MLNQYQKNDQQSIENDHRKIQQLTQRWAEIWSPKAQKFTGQGLEQIFATDDNSMIVFDNIGGSLIVLHSFQDYLDTWLPLMEQFTFWEIEIEDNLQISVSGDLAFTTFSFMGIGRDKDEQDYKVRQYGTHVWQRKGDQWQIVHEHLTVGA